jgi:3-isopropylmalate dehydratase small subunit
MTDLSQRTQSLGGPEYFTWKIYERNNINVNVNAVSTTDQDIPQNENLMRQCQSVINNAIPVIAQTVITVLQQNGCIPKTIQQHRLHVLKLQMDGIHLCIYRVHCNHNTIPQTTLP